MLYWIVLYWYYIKTKWNYNTLTVPCQKSKIVSLASSIIKNISVCPYQSNYNLANNQLYNHLVDQWKSFECYHMLLNHLLLVDQKRFSISHKIVVFCFYNQNKILLVTYSMFMIFKWWSKKYIYALKTYLNIGFVSVMLILIDICSS